MVGRAGRVGIVVDLELGVAERSRADQGDLHHVRHVDVLAVRVFPTAVRRVSAVLHIAAGLEHHLDGLRTFDCFQLRRDQISGVVRNAHFHESVAAERQRFLVSLGGGHHCIAPSLRTVAVFGNPVVDALFARGGPDIVRSGNQQPVECFVQDDFPDGLVGPELLDGQYRRQRRELFGTDRYRPRTRQHFGVLLYGDRDSAGGLFSRDPVGSGVAGDSPVVDADIRIHGDGRCFAFGREHCELTGLKREREGVLPDADALVHLRVGRRGDCQHGAAAVQVVIGVGGDDDRVVDDLCGEPLSVFEPESPVADAGFQCHGRGTA